MARILYIEDYQPAALTMTFVMDELGHECVIAPTGQAALDLYGARGFDLVLIDHHLPDMNGPDVAKGIRALERANAMKPTILLAYSAGNKSVDTYREEGMDGFAAKSLSLSDVRALLQRYLKS